MPTLEEIAQKEPLILLDTSGLWPDGKRGIELEIRLLNDIINKIKAGLPLFMLPETIDEIVDYREVSKRGLRKHKRMYKKKFAHFKAYNDTQILISEKHRLINQLIKQLNSIKVPLDPEENPLYKAFLRVTSCLKDKLKVKGKDSNPDNKTDENNIAAALYFSTFGQGAALISKDRHFQKLLEYAVRELQNPGLSPLNQKVLEPLCKRGIRIYSRVGINSYNVVLDTASSPINEDPELKMGDMLYLKLQLRLINSPV